MTPSDEHTDVEVAAETLRLTRVFEAPRDRVWAAWTDPAQVDRWWGPDGYSTATDSMDVSEGGRWRFAMHGPDGERYPNLIVYETVEPPARLAYVHGSPDEPDQFRVTVTFEELTDDATEVTMAMRFPSTSALDEAVDFGAVEGAKQTLARLAVHLDG